MDLFLNSVLQVIVALDVLGIIAYFVLGGIRSRSRKKQPAIQPLSRPSSLWDRLGWRSAPRESPEVLEPAFANLRRVLHSYQQGLL